MGAYTKDAISETIQPVDLDADKVLAFDVNKPFTYQIEFAFQPTVSFKRPYKGLKVKWSTICKLFCTFMWYAAIATASRLPGSTAVPRASIPRAGRPLHFCFIVYDTSMCVQKDWPASQHNP